MKCRYCRTEVPDGHYDLISTMENWQGAGPAMFAMEMKGQPGEVVHVCRNGIPDVKEPILVHGHLSLAEMHRSNRAALRLVMEKTKDHPVLFLDVEGPSCLSRFKTK